MQKETVANIVGALARAVTDAIEDDIATTGQGAAGAAALVHLSKYRGERINDLRVPLELSHPGCVRLVDRLEERKLVARSDASDGRAVAGHLPTSWADVRSAGAGQVDHIAIEPSVLLQLSQPATLCDHGGESDGSKSIYQEVFLEHGGLRGQG